MSIPTLHVQRLATSTKADFSVLGYRTVAHAVSLFPGADARSTEMRLEKITRELGVSQLTARLMVGAYLRYDEVTVNVDGLVWWVAKA